MGRDALRWKAQSSEQSHENKNQEKKGKHYFKCKLWKKYYIMHNFVVL